MKNKKNIQKLKDAKSNREYNIIRKNYKCYCITCNRRAGIFDAYCGPRSNKTQKSWKLFRTHQWKKHPQLSWFRAFALQARGPRFESQRVHQTIINMDTQRLNHFAENLLTFPQIIQENQIALLDTTEEIYRVNKEISVLESKIRSDIAAEVDENNKKVYPNAESRDAAFVEKSSQNPEITNLQSQHTSLQRLSNIRRFEIERLQNEQRNLRSVLDFFKSI